MRQHRRPRRGRRRQGREGDRLPLDQHRYSSAATQLVELSAQIAIFGLQLGDAPLLELHEVAHLALTHLLLSHLRSLSPALTSPRHQVLVCSPWRPTNRHRHPHARKCSLSSPKRIIRYVRCVVCRREVLPSRCRAHSPAGAAASGAGRRSRSSGATRSQMRAATSAFGKSPNCSTRPPTWKIVTSLVEVPKPLPGRETSFATSRSSRLLV